MIPPETWTMKSVQYTPLFKGKTKVWIFKDRNTKITTKIT